MTRWLPIATLRVRLILLVLLAIIPALAIMLYTAAESRRHEAALAQAEVRTLTRLIANQEEQLIESTRQLLITLAQLPVVGSGDTAACDTLFANLIKQYPYYVGMGSADAEGKVVCSSVPLTSPVNVSDRLWFQQAVQSRNFVIGQYQVGRVLDEAALPLAYPLLNSTGQVEGVVSVGLKLGRLAALGAQIPFTEEATIIEIDRDGTILDRYHDPEQWIGQHLPEAPLI